MQPVDLITLNFEETRRRSILIWKSIPEELAFWKPDKDALNCIEMVRHVLEGEYEYYHIITKGADVPFPSPWKDRPYKSIADELQFALPFRQQFMSYVQSLTTKDLEEKEILRPAKNQRRKLGDYLLRIAYHDSVHAGQLLSYLRTLQVKRPEIWD